MIPSSSSFHTTRWTLVTQSRGGDTVSKQALSDLCATYYAPVVGFISRHGFDEHLARDLAHDFFARLLASPQSLKPDPARGRFRSYLLGAVKHFVSDALASQRTEKRGGKSDIVHLTESSLVQPEDASLAPDREFDRQWALAVLDLVVRRLAAEFDAAGRAAYFALLRPWLTGDDDSLSQAAVAEQLGMNEGSVKVAIHRLRKRFRELIKLEVAHTVSTDDEVRQELAHLLTAM